MAARRTRIKGIASIPQRRKAAIAVTELKETPQLGSQADEQSDVKEGNFNSLHEESSVTAPKSTECHAQDISGVKSESLNNLSRKAFTEVKETTQLKPQADEKCDKKVHYINSENVVPGESPVTTPQLLSACHKQDTLEIKSSRSEAERNTVASAAEAILQGTLKPNKVFFKSRLTTFTQDQLTTNNGEPQSTQQQIVSRQQSKRDVDLVIPAELQTEQDTTDLRASEIENESQQDSQFSGEGPKSDELQQNVSSEKTLPQPNGSIIRRRFIKPSLSLNGLSRKARSAELNPHRNNKIIILNEIISSADSDKPLVINHYNQRLEEKHEEIVNPTIQNSRVEENKVEELLEKPVEKSFSEQLIPPPSPSKVNRTRIKAVPRLGQRHTSFSASESEDESRRNSRHRNDSICSTTSGLQDNNSNLESLSPQKTREFNTLIQRKCRRTEQSRKLAEARRDFYLKFGNQKPDREKLTMIDLIFYNPTTNLMTDTKQKKENKEEAVQKDQDEEEIEKIEEANEDNPEKQASDEENEIPAPQIKIGPEGEIIIDEQSLVIENKAVKKSREELEKQKIIDTDFETGYGIYKRAKRSKDWNKDETLKFYKALNTIGTDFTLMCELFPRRSRRELKLKFKKEERINKALIDRAIMKPCGFDFNDFKQEVEIEEQELKEVEKQKERELQMKKENKKRKMPNGKTEVKEKVSKTDIVKPVPKKKKPFDIMSVLDDDSAADASESGSDSVDNFERDTSILEAMKKPTRSGRVPKILKRYQSSVYEEPPKSPANVELGSLVVVAETGNNGEPVYKVCMVTGEDNRQQISDNMPAINTVLQTQTIGEAGCLESIFTLTTTRLDGPDETISDILEERNVTIPADEAMPMDISSA